jgi:hypothetical protein
MLRKKPYDQWVYNLKFYSHPQGSFTHNGIGTTGIYIQELPNPLCDFFSIGFIHVFLWELMVFFEKSISVKETSEAIL